MMGNVYTDPTLKKKKTVPDRSLEKKPGYGSDIQKEKNRIRIRPWKYKPDSDPTYPLTLVIKKNQFKSQYDYDIKTLL